MSLLAKLAVEFLSGDLLHTGRIRRGGDDVKLAEAAATLESTSFIESNTPQLLSSSCGTARRFAQEELYRRHGRMAARTSFYIDCGRHHFLPMRPGNMIKCLKAKHFFGGLLGWKKKGPKTLMHVLPKDYSCKWVYFVLHRRARQWYKCCDSKGPIINMLMNKKWLCQKVTPSAWYPNRVGGQKMLWDLRGVNMCWRMRPTDFWNCPGPNYTNCTHMKEQCVTLQKSGFSSDWPANTFKRNGVTVFMFCTPALALLPADLSIASKDGEKEGAEVDLESHCRGGNISISMSAEAWFSFSSVSSLKMAKKEEEEEYDEKEDEDEVEEDDEEKEKHMVAEVEKEELPVPRHQVRQYRITELSSFF